MKRITIIALASLALAGAVIAGIIQYGALTGNRAAYVDQDGKVRSSTVTADELGYLSGVTSGLQAQINAKASGTGGITNGLFKGGSFSSQTNTDLIASGFVAADANQMLAGKTSPQAKLMLGIDSGTATASADGTKTQTFALTYSSAPIVITTPVNSGTPTNTVVSCATTGFVFKTGSAGVVVNWIAIGAP
jgi:hypothetical protein